MRRAIAWPATLAILATFILAPTPAVADEGAAPVDPVAETAPAEVAPTEDAPVDDPGGVEAEAGEEGLPAVDDTEEPAPAAAQRSAAPTAAPQASPPVASAVTAADLGISVSPASVLPGEDFTFSLTGCPYVAGSPSYAQLPVLQVVHPDLVTNVTNSDDVLGGIHSGFSGSFAGDPWEHTSTVAIDAPPGNYRIYARCALDAGTTNVFGPYTTLTVLDPTAPPTPTETISPASGYAGHQFTANIENCPTGLGPNGYSLTQNAADHSGPTPFLTAFDYVSIDASVEPKTYTWEVTDDAAPGDYTIIFRCYAEADQPAVQMNSMTFTVLADPFVFDGVATIDHTSGYPGDELTITGTGCSGGSFDLGIGDPPGFLAAEDFELVGHNAFSGDDPMWITIRLTDSAARGTYEWLPLCTMGQDEYDYEPLVYTLLEPESTTPTSSTPDDTPHDVASVSTQALPDTGSSTSPALMYSAFLSMLLGLLMVMAARRRA